MERDEIFLRVLEIYKYFFEICFEKGKSWLESRWRSIWSRNLSWNKWIVRRVYGGVCIEDGRI